MAVNGIASFFQNISDQLFGPAKQGLDGTNTPGTLIASNAPLAEDVFTPSSHVDSVLGTAKDAGIFQITQGVDNPNAANPHAGAANPASTANLGTSISVGQSASKSRSAQATASGAASVNELQQIQALNAALPALGLTNTEIDQIDRIASLVNNFNPAAYASLVSQFEQLAQQATPAKPVNAPVIPGTDGVAITGTSAICSGFHLQQILLKFTGAQQNPADNSAASSSGTQGTAANNVAPATPGPQIATVQFILIDRKGQTVQVQTL